LESDLLIGAVVKFFNLAPVFLAAAVVFFLVVAIYLSHLYVQNSVALQGKNPEFRQKYVN
jgi:hypothetical protein